MSMQRWAAHRRIVLPLFSPWQRRSHTVQTQKIDVADRPIPPPPIILSRPIDPHLILASELSTLRQNLLNLLGSAHPSLQDLARHYFADTSSLVRSCVILLFARATNASGPGWEQAAWAACSEDARELDQPLTRADVLPYWNPNMPDHAESFDSVFALRTPTPTPKRRSGSPSISLSSSLLPTQLRLAQIVEMIHTASILHDQVTLSPSDSSNKLSILGGDFLLGRACAALSRLGSNHVVELIGSVISNLSEGRVVMSSSWDEYLKNAYLKTGSLMAKGTRSAVLLAGGTQPMQDMAFAFGRNLGMAMQFAEYAAEGGAPRCWDVAHAYSQRATEILRFLPDNDTRDALELVVNSIVDRQRTP